LFKKIDISKALLAPFPIGWGSLTDAHLHPNFQLASYALDYATTCMISLKNASAKVEAARCKLVKAQ
jgi:hypothetical protein